MISIHSWHPFNWELLFTLFGCLFQPVSLAGGGRGIAVTAKGGKGKNVVRPYDPNESNGSWSVVLVVIVPVVQIVVVVVLCLITHHLYMKYCKPLLCLCCRRQRNDEANGTRTRETPTGRAVRQVISSDTDSGDACAVPMTTLGASVWHSSVNSLFMNGTAPSTVAAASTQTDSTFNSNRHRHKFGGIYWHSVLSPADAVIINCDLVENHARDIPYTKTVNRPCPPRGAHCTSTRNTRNSNSNQRAVRVSNNGFHFKNNPTQPQVVYRPNEVSCVVECHLPPESPPPETSAPVLSSSSSNAYQSNQMKYPMSLPSSSHQQYRPVLVRSDALTCTSRANYFPDCDVIDASDELEEDGRLAVSLNGDLEEEAELPEIKELFWPHNPSCVVHNPNHKESRSVSANSKSPYFISNYKTKQILDSR